MCRLEQLFHKKRNRAHHHCRAAAAPTPPLQPHRVDPRRLINLTPRLPHAHPLPHHIRVPICHLTEATDGGVEQEKDIR